MPDDEREQNERRGSARSPDMTPGAESSSASEESKAPEPASSLAAETAVARAPQHRGRFPEAEIERLKRDISIVRLVEARGVKLTGRGDNLMGLCPLPGHDDRTPSLVVSPSKNIWHCLGACQAGGSVIDWVMKSQRVSFRLAVAMLQQQAPALSAFVQPLGVKPKLEELAEPDEPDAVVLRRVALEAYPANLKQSLEPQAYLEKRGLKSAEMVEHFHLGYSNRTLAYRVPSGAAKEGAALRAQLQRIGLYRASGHEHLVGTLTIPVLGEDGEVLELYGRKIRDRLPKAEPRHLYLPARPDGRRGVFNLPALKAAKDIILCEALIDALTFWAAGHRNVTSAYGVEGFTIEMRDAMIEHETRRILIAYDADDAGNRAAEKLARDLAHEGFEVFRVLFPRGMDANEYALKVKPPAKAFETSIQSAKWMAGTRPVVVPEAIAPPTAIAETSPASPSRAPAPAAAPKAEVAPAATIDARTTAAPPLPADSPPAAVTSAPALNPLPSQANGQVRGPDPEPGRIEEAPAVDPSPSLAADGAATATRAPQEVPLVDAEVYDDEVRIRLGDRRWRIRGLTKNTAYDSLRINLLVATGDAFYVDTLELYSARHRMAFLRDAAHELKVEERVLKADITKIILRLEDLVDQRIRQATTTETRAAMSDKERAAALELLRDPRLADRILEDFEKAGVVGEETNKLVGYLAAVSRKLDAPLAVVIQSSSAAGKSSLMDAILRFMPEEERVQYSAMTGQSLFYMGEADLKHKILAIAEEQGVQSAAYALKLLQSQGELTIASTGKDPVTGKLVTHDYRVQGPVMIFFTTTAIEVDEELLNRCLVLTVDEGPRQTSAIHDRQRRAKTLEGQLSKEDANELCRLHQNAQRLLEPILVANPFATQIRFSNRITRTRRDHLKYLTLISAITLLHQHQRPLKEVEHRGKRYRYIETTEADIEMANRIARAVLGHGLDELPPQTRRLLELIRELVAQLARERGLEISAVRFTRRDIRNHTRWGDTQLKVHLARLEELEYLLVHAGGARRRMVYELAVNAPDPGTVPTPFDTSDERTHASGRGAGHLGGGWSAPGRGGPPRPETNDSARNFAAASNLGGANEEALLPPSASGLAPTVHVPPKNGAARAALSAEGSPS